ncbi:Pol protein [Pyrenophora tritici-repentis]|nr:Pol protein [Pyrenophora tritici-repentis]KAI1670791.1 Pol protein [Pyrenophora tritici-repentis]
MATTSTNTSSVTRATTILQGSADWTPWFSAKRRYATIKGVWQYCDPDSTAESPPPVEEPSDEDSAEKWKIWEIKSRRQESIQKAIGEVNLEILRTVATTHVHLIDGAEHDDPRSQLTTLRKHFKVTDQQRRIELATRYSDIQKKPKNQSVQAWLDEYSQVTSQCAQEKMPEMTETRSQWRFIHAVRDSGDEAWAQAQFLAMEQGEANALWPTPTLQDLIGRYRRTAPTVQNTTKTLGSFTSSLSITESKPTGEPKKHPRGEPRQCVCGLHLSVLDCYTLNQQAKGRREDFKPNSKALSQLVKAFRNKDTLKKAKKAYKDAGIQWTFDVEKAKAELAKRKNSASRQAYQAETSSDCSSDGYASNAAYFSQPLQSNAASSLHDRSMQNRWVMDPGSNVHICNKIGANWKQTKLPSPQDKVQAGCNSHRVQAWGEVTLDVRRGNETASITLKKVAYIPGFIANIFSLSCCKKIHFNSKTNKLFKEDESQVFSDLERVRGHWFLNAQDARQPFQAMATDSTHAKSPQVVTAMQAHRVLGHLSYQAIEHLKDSTTGLRVGTNGRGDQWTDACTSCIKGKMKEDVSRRPRADKACRPFYRIIVDIIQLQKHGEACYNGDVWALHAVCEYTKLHEICTLKDRQKATVVPAITRLINKIERVYGYQVAIVFMDGDVGYGRAEANSGSSAREVLTTAGIKVETRSPDTPAQLGGAERAGASIVTVARVLRIHAGLPKTLANELVCTAARLLNITPTKSIDWRTPHEMVTGVRPDLSRLHAIGSRGFVLNKHLPRGDKLEDRTFEGFLLGYDASNIYRVWLPATNRVIRVRDVRFIDELYKDKPSTLPARPHVIETAHIPEEEYDGDTIVVAQPITQRQATVTSSPLQKQIHQLPSPTITARGTPDPRDTPDPWETPHPPDSPDLVEQQLFQESSASRASQHTTPGGWNFDETHDHDRDTIRVAVPTREFDTHQPYVPDRYQNNAPQRRDPDLSQDNIVTGKRRRQAHFIEASPSTKYYAFAAAIQQSYEATSLASGPRIKRDPTRVHHDDLPPPPRHWKELKQHPHGKQFEAAAHTEFNNCWNKGTFARPDITVSYIDDAVPLMWVFTYKFDEDGYLLKYKARLVVRGDLQEQYGDTYAATLAARLFRALMALACAFNLKAMQYDVPNAFLNAILDRTLYVRTPDGFQDKYGRTLRLLRALYGLKEAPRLWAIHFQESLRKLGLQPVQGFPCLWMNTRVILFFYVDDIIILYHPDYQKDFDKLEQQLIKLYNLRQIGEVKWFLGIRVERVLASRQLYLVQDAFIDKVCTEFDLIRADERYPSTPLSSTSSLALYDGISEPSNTKTYQRLVGNLAYIEVMTRPDVAHAHSVLARFLTNPGPIHLSEIKHVWQYLYGTRYLAISARGGEPTQTYATKIDATIPIFFGAADASFGDDVETRRSSAGYVFMLYGMPIDWKATVLRSVTRSTTEAELYALSAASIKSQY